jgi:hypothetical protein
LSLEAIPQKAAGFDPDLWMKPSQNKAGVLRNLGPNGRPMRRLEPYDGRVREVGPNQNTLFLAYSPQWDGTSARDELQALPARPTQAKAGRLRLARTGVALSYLVAEGADEEFSLLHEDSFGEKDLNQLRVVATTSGVTAALTVRLTDLHVRAQSFGKPPALIQRQRQAWWKPLVTVVSLMLVLPLGVVLYLRRRRTGTVPAYASAPAGRAKAEAAADRVAFPCAVCGKKLRTRTDLAGKMVKCPHCGKVVQVPQTGPSGPDASLAESIKPKPG